MLSYLLHVVEHLLYWQEVTFYECIMTIWPLRDCLVKSITPQCSQRLPGPSLYCILPPLIDLDVVYQLEYLIFPYLIFFFFFVNLQQMSIVLV